ncbi:hypothetical protein BU24DRAFT_469648 [Aaosphaeria arxii CBS 175.79]|uniref:Cyanovirin-N domain-containing protein n=1 Tax=Aaosphaeria arxii CBS 175.79 TaxID=1450172 RepID=A0A6A5Y7T4_9PLEO|nr:uncharacterized protein BU24DRAFT_469648 [Aaosphaeria arxii CBS 175.79]KAF2020860.1 hypothetical protein BU24DRAFT_469648 [Aaosphaeria arxii CBS 175.79]
MHIPFAYWLYVLGAVSLSTALSCGQAHGEAVSWLPLKNDGRFHTGFLPIEWGHVGYHCVCEFWENANCHDGITRVIDTVNHPIFHGHFGTNFRCYRCQQYL